MFLIAVTIATFCPGKLLLSTTETHFSESLGFVMFSPKFIMCRGFEGNNPFIYRLD